MINKENNISIKLKNNDHLLSDSYTCELKVIKRPDYHQPFNPVKDFTIAFITVYKNLNILMSNQYIKKDINLETITWAVSDIIYEYYYNENNPSKCSHFFLSLLYKNEVMKKGEKRPINIISESALTNFNTIELIKLSALSVNAKRNNDRFWQSIENANVKKYEDFPTIIKEIHKSDKNTFESILLELGYTKND